MTHPRYTGNVLVVDDTPQNVQLLTRILRSEGHTIQTALSGMDAIDTAHEVIPDVVLLDIQMPEMDGYEVCEYFKANETLMHIPIIFISALTDTEGIIKALHAGGVDYVTKPFNIQEVVARVNSQMVVVEQRREIDRLHEQDIQHYHAIDDMKNEFIRMATHDLKNPLGIVMGYAEIFEHIQIQDERQRALMDQGLDAIQHAIDKMMNLVTDMLDLAKMGTNVGLQLETMELVPVVSRWVEAHRVRADEKEQWLNFTSDHEEFTVEMDPRSFERVVDNLVSNAIKYTPEGGRIDVSIEQGEDCAIIKVADNGYGIPTDSLGSIFNAFYRVPLEEHRQAEGTGLGLSIVKTIVEQHDGRIYVESQLGKGSTFFVILPIL